MKQEFKIVGDYIELIQLLKALGIAETGGHAKMIVEEGDVIRNGEVELRKRAKLIPASPSSTLHCQSGLSKDLTSHTPRLNKPTKSKLLSGDHSKCSIKSTKLNLLTNFELSVS